MSYITGIFRNEIIVTAVSCWAIAQILKAVIYLIVHRSFSIERLLGDGGMPSSHSATVAGMTVAVAFACGTDHPLFALAFIFAVVVMHDAMGVRLETGKQAAVLNDMIELFTDMGKSIPAEDKLKEFVGHTPLQVFFGALTGIAAGILIHFLFYAG